MSAPRLPIPPIRHQGNRSARAQMHKTAASSVVFPAQVWPAIPVAHQADYDGGVSNPDQELQPVRRVIVAEDESVIRLDIVEMLREVGYDVVGEAGDGESAVRLAEELRPDLVVMDIKMPKLDGISAAEKIARASIAPVVLLTAFSQKELVERARDAGAMAYVVKPFTAADLVPALEIAQSRYQEIQALESEIADMTDRFETRKLVERAKGLLISNMGLTEPEAFRWIQKTSMDRRLTMREVAETVLNQLDSKD